MNGVSDETFAYINNLLIQTPKLVEDRIKKNNDYFNYRGDYFKLKKFIDAVLEGDSEDRYIIMPGLRGVGKTTIIFQIYNYLYNECNIHEKRLLYLDLGRAKDIPNFDLQQYLDFFIRQVNGANPVLDEPVFIFVDESQYSHDWSMNGKIIFDEQKKAFMIFTGSDALNLEYKNESARRALKMNIYPLNFQEYLNLKYDISIGNAKVMEEMLLFGDVEESQKLERDFLFNHLLQSKLNRTETFEYYLQYGGFPFCINRNEEQIIQLTINLKDRIIEKDLDVLSSFTSSTRLTTYKLINFLAIQKPADVSLSKLTNILDKSKETINSILSTLEKTQLIFHIEPYGSVSKRIRKSWEYYFLAPQIKAAIYLDYGQASRNPNEYKAILTENMVASTLFKIKNKRNNMFSIFYDPRKGGVDFLINDIMGNVIPLEVGYGKKDTKQVRSAMNKYGSEFGIVVSNRTSAIEKDDNIINIPLSTFALL